MATRPTPNCPQMRPTRFGLADAALLVCLLACAGWVAYRLLFTFPYTWNWASIPQFIAVQTEHGWAPGILGKGLFTTIRLGVWSSLLALFLGCAGALGRTSRNPYTRLLARTAIELCRNLPPLVLVFVFYYFLSSQMLPWPLLLQWIEGWPALAQSALAFAVGPVDALDVFLPAVLTLALYEGAYVAEILRGGLEAVHKGQWEASYCLGLSRWQQYRHIIWPQVLRAVLPQLSGQCISTIKDSAIVAVISIEELTYSGMQLMATIKQPFEVWLTVTALYLLLTLGVSCLFRRMER